MQEMKEKNKGHYLRNKLEFIRLFDVSSIINNIKTNERNTKMRDIPLEFLYITETKSVFN